MGMRIPLGQTRASLQLVTVADQDGRTIRNLVALTLATIGIDDADFTGTRDSDQQAVLVGDGLEVVYARGTGSTRVDTVRRRSDEHTSDLQSLMRHSYAVFFLTKKNKHDLI